MLATLLVVFVLQAISADGEDIYVVDQLEGAKVVSIPVPKGYKILKLDNVEYIRDNSGSTCTMSGSPDKTLTCTYDEKSKTATVEIAKVEKTAWVGFGVYPGNPSGSTSQDGYQTVFFSQGDKWTQVKDKGCIQPQHSSPGLIGAKGLDTVPIKCARKTKCGPVDKSDEYLAISIEGDRKCKKDDEPTLVCAPVKNAIDGVDIYEFKVPKPPASRADASSKTYAYCSTAISEMSFVIDWNLEPTTSGVSRLAYVIAPVWALVAMMWM